MSHPTRTTWPAPVPESLSTLLADQGPDPVQTPEVDGTIEVTIAETLLRLASDGDAETAALIVEAIRDASRTVSAEDDPSLRQRAGHRDRPCKRRRVCRADARLRVRGRGRPGTAAAARRRTVGWSSVRRCRPW